MKSFFKSLQAELVDYPDFTLCQIVSDYDTNHKIDIRFQGNFNPISSIAMMLYNFDMKILTYNVYTKYYGDGMMNIMDHYIIIECEYDFNRLMIDNQEI